MFFLVMSNQQNNCHLIFTERVYRCIPKLRKAQENKEYKENDLDRFGRLEQGRFTLIVKVSMNNYYFEQCIQVDDN